MKIVEKPEGLELRDLRSTKTGKAYDWLGHDALYEAAQAMPKDTKTCIVIWQEETPAGVDTHHRLAGRGNDAIAALSQVLHARLG